MYCLAEFCAGTGAFSVASKMVGGIECVFANDICKNSKKIFDENNNISLTLGDIHDINVSVIPSMDIITAGFPCQPFSIAGEKRGFDDNRSEVFWKILEIVKFHKPKCVILENVKNLLTHNKSKTLDTILNSLKTIGYSIKYKVLNTCIHTNIPHNRERIYIICFLSENSCSKFKFPEPLGEVLELKEILQDDIDDKYYYTKKSKVYDKVNSQVVKNIDTNTLYQYRRTLVRENKSNVCPTITANAGGGGHNVPLLRDSNGVRKLTPRECFRLQGFPDDYKFPETLSDSALYKLAGNAVTVTLVAEIFKKILDCLE